MCFVVKRADCATSRIPCAWLIVHFAFSFHSVTSKVSNHSAFHFVFLLLGVSMLAQSVDLHAVSTAAKTAWRGPKVLEATAADSTSDTAAADVDQGTDVVTEHQPAYSPISHEHSQHDTPPGLKAILKYVHMHCVAAIGQ